MAGTDDSPRDAERAEDSTHADLTQHGADDISEDWDVAATDPRPTGSGAGETPEAAAEGYGGQDGNLAGPGRFHDEEEPD
jgi:hypothetical protein